MKLSLKIKLVTTPTDKEALHQIMFTFNAACNDISRLAFEKKVFNNFSLHHLLYSKLREKYKLPSQFVISALSKVADSYTTEITKATQEQRELTLCRFKSHAAIAYDSRLLTYGKENTVNIKTPLSKRLRLATCIYAPEKIPLFKGEADLIYTLGEFYIIQTIDVAKAKPIVITDYIGVDLGIVKIAVDSDGLEYSDATIETKRVKYTKQRTRLKKVKTKNSRRHLKKFGNKEARFRKDVNHRISRAIVTNAERTSRGIALENLVQFFDKTRVRKDYRAQRCSWSFFQLRSFTTYKAVLKGIPVVLVNPAYTSQRCSECGYTDKANRKSQANFLCQNPDPEVNCHHAENADVNASKNIKYWAAVNQPIAAISGSA